MSLTPCPVLNGRKIRTKSHFGGQESTHSYSLVTYTTQWVDPLYASKIMHRYTGADPASYNKRGF